MILYRKNYIIPITQNGKKMYVFYDKYSMIKVYTETLERAIQFIDKIRGSE